MYALLNLALGNREAFLDVSFVIQSLERFYHVIFNPKNQECLGIAT